MDELVSAGAEGLARAIAGYDPSRGRTFGQYARWRITMAIRDHLRSWFHLRASSAPSVELTADVGERVADAPEGPPAFDAAAKDERLTFWDTITDGMGDRMRTIFLARWRDELSADRIASMQKPRIGKRRVQQILQRAARHVARCHARYAAEFLVQG